MIAYFDIFSGISGDMCLGAFVDLGVPVEWIETQLSGVLKGFRIQTRTVKKNHLKAVDLSVDITDPHQTSRDYKEIRSLIEKSSLSLKVKTQSLTAFEKIAKAESHIHDKEIDKIHFHEVGGVDSIVDIIGTFLCVDYLDIQTIHASTIPLGSGSIKCSHGDIPVPVPATLSILKDIPVRPSDAATEIVTPTGAAIISTLSCSFGAMPAMVIKQTGYGSGKRDTGSALPNLLRIILGESPELKKEKQAAGCHETIYSVKTNVDDMNPEISGFLMELLLESSALDVCYLPVQMKKNRPGLQIEVLCFKEDLDNIINLILSQTTSIGVRYHRCARSYLSRQKAFIDTRFGKLQVKKITNPDNSFRYVPEYDAVKKTAIQKQMALKDVYNQVLSDIDTLLLKQT